jgi:hypothetical protein
MREVRSLTEAEIDDNDELVAAMWYVTVSDDIDVKKGPVPDLGVPPAMEYEIGTLPGSNCRWDVWPSICSSHWCYSLAYHLKLLCEVVWYYEVPQLMWWLCVEGLQPFLRQTLRGSAHDGETVKGEVRERCIQVLLTSSVDSPLP